MSLHAGAEGPENEGNQRHNAIVTLALVANSIGGPNCASRDEMHMLGLALLFISC